MTYNNQSESWITRGLGLSFRIPLETWISVIVCLVFCVGTGLGIGRLPDSGVRQYVEEPFGSEFGLIRVNSNFTKMIWKCSTRLSLD